MNRSSLILLLFAASFTATAQSPSDYAFRSRECFEPGQTCEAMVIAWSGLRLREKPDFKARTLALLPYGQKVTFSRDSLDRRYAQPLVYDSDSIPGYWQWVAAPGKSGYVFSAYLAGSVWKMTKPFYLLYEQSAWCWNDAYLSDSYHYYGVYPNDDTSQLVIREMKPLFYTPPDDGYGETTTFTFKQSEVSLFAFATREPFVGHAFRIKAPEKAVKLVYRPDQDPETERIEVPDSPWEIKFAGIRSDGAENEQPYSTRPVLRDKITGAWHYLFPDQYQWFGHVQLLWSGDFDGDGITDFMLEVGSDHDLGHALFLSSNPGKWHFVRLAGMYWWGDCC